MYAAVSESTDGFDPFQKLSFILITELFVTPIRPPAFNDLK